MIIDRKSFHVQHHSPNHRNKTPVESKRQAGNFNKSSIEYEDCRYLSPIILMSVPFSRYRHSSEDGNIGFGMLFYAQLDVEALGAIKAQKLRIARLTSVDKTLLRHCLEAPMILFRLHPHLKCAFKVSYLE